MPDSPLDPEDEGACITVGALTIERKKKRSPMAPFDVASEFKLSINGKDLLDIGSISEIALKFSGGKNGNEIVKTVITVDGPSREPALAIRAREIAEKTKDLPRIDMAPKDQTPLTDAEKESLARHCTEYGLINGEYVPISEPVREKFPDSIGAAAAREEHA